MKAAIIVVMLGAGARAGVPVIYVDASAPAGGDGSSWASAFRDLQDGLAAGAGIGEGAEVWVASGTYRPDRGTRNRDMTFELSSNVGVYGGFAGTETEREERDPVANETVLSGDLNSNDGPNFVNYSDNSRHVVTASLTDDTAVLEGFSIIGGNADFPGEQLLGGGGLFIVSASPAVRGCAFRANSSGENKPNIGGFGGGAYVLIEAAGPVRPVFEACVFTGNRGDSGGAFGILNRDGLAAHRVVLTDCEFVSNAAVHQTGGAAFVACSPFTPNVEQDVRYERCRFEGNRAAYAGAMIDQNSVELEIIDCEFVSNRSDLAAGAVWHIQTAQDDVSPAVIRGCVFHDNQGGGGGALNFNATDAIVSECGFFGNRATSGYGGAIFTGRYAFGCGRSLEVVNCVLSGNRAMVGGAIAADCGPGVAIDDSTLSGNTATNAAGGVYTDQTLDIANSILWHNAANGGMSEAAQIFASAPVSVDHSIVEGWSGGFGGDGNNGLDPVFANAAGADGILGTPDDDVRLGSGSPGVDSGNNERVPLDALDLDGDGNTTEAIPFDIDGLSRFADDPGTSDTGEGKAPIVDRGAHELQGAPCVADMDENGVLNIFDFLAFQTAFSEEDPRADLAAPFGVFNLFDFLAFQTAFGNGC